MGIKSHKHPRLTTFLLLLILSFSPLTVQIAQAETIILPIKRVVPTQPITQLEIVALVKSVLSGRVLSIKKQSTYSNPDCHHVKFLEDKGEFQMIEIGCFVENIAKNQ